MLKRSKGCKGSNLTKQYTMINSKKKKIETFKKRANVIKKTTRQATRPKQKTKKHKIRGSCSTLIVFE